MRHGRTLPAGVICCLLAGLYSTTAEAGAWNKKKGQGQVILKWEAMRATEGFDTNGILQPLLAEREETTWSAVVEYGLTDTLTVQAKGDWQDGHDAGFDYQGRGPVEVGVAWQVWRDDNTAVSLYGGVAEAGDARNAGYALPGQGGRDYEIRASIGRSIQREEARFGPENMFAEVQLARRVREALPDETRLDLTVGTHVGQNWMLLGQAFGGVADNNGPRWLSLETSVVRHFGDWSLQAGARRAVWGQDSPAHEGVVVALWRRF